MSRQQWDQLYKNKGRVYLTPHSSMDRAISYFNHYRISKVLELGCGSGRNIVRFAEKGFMITGVEQSPAAAALAEKWLKSKGYKSKVYVADIEQKISFLEDESYEAIVAIDVLEYYNKDSIKKITGEILRILKTGGIFYLVVTSETKAHSIERFGYDLEEIKGLVEDKFRILELTKEKNGDIVLICQEK